MVCAQGSVSVKALDPSKARRRHLPHRSSRTPDGVCDYAGCGRAKSIRRPEVGDETYAVSRLTAAVLHIQGRSARRRVGSQRRLTFVGVWLVNRTVRDGVDRECWTMDYTQGQLP